MWTAISKWNGSFHQIFQSTSQVVGMENSFVVVEGVGEDKKNLWEDYWEDSYEDYCEDSYEDYWEEFYEDSWEEVN